MGQKRQQKCRDNLIPFEEVALNRDFDIAITEKHEAEEQRLAAERSRRFQEELSIDLSKL